MIFANTFDSVSEFRAFVTGPCALPANESVRADSFRNYSENKKWVGIAKDIKPGETALACVERLVSGGWVRGLKLMGQVASVDAPPARAIRRRLARRDHGDDIDMQAVWRGDLDRAWITTTRASVSGPTRVRIICDALASAHVEAESMVWRGIAAMKLADALQTAGYSVQVESAFNGGCFNGHTYIPRVIIKSYLSPLDMGALAGAAALPAFFRVLGHAFLPTVCDYGNPSVSYRVSPLEKKSVADAGDDAALFIAGQKIDSAEKAGAWVAACIERLQGVA